MALITDENPDPTTLCEGNWYTFGCLDSIWYYRAYCRELRESEQGGYATKLAERLAGIRINKVEAGKTKRGAIRYMWVVWCEAGRFESKVHVLTCLSAKDAHEAAATIIEQRNAQAQARITTGHVLTPRVSHAQVRQKT